MIRPAVRIDRARARERVVLAAYAGAWRVIRVLPEPAAYGAFRAAADLAWWRHGPGVHRLEANLARVRPGLDQVGLRRLSRLGMRSYLRYWCDAFRLPDWSADRVSRSVRTVGDEPVRRALDQGRGVVMFLGHLGNWDHAGAWSALHLAPVTTVAERLRPEELFERFLDFRRRLGMRIVPLTGGSDVFRTLLRTLQDGGFVPLLADRDLTDGGMVVDLFGEPARVAVGPAALAQATGAALFPVSIRYERTGRRWGIVITWHDEVVPTADAAGPAARRGDVQRMTQECVDALAGAISQAPQDWHMLQRVFVADLAGRSGGGR